MVFSQQEFMKRIEELESMDESTNVKHLPRSKWPKDLITGKILLWQVPCDTARMLHILVKLHRPAHILELGTSAGYSTLWMYKAANEYGGTIDTVEFSDYRFNLAKESFEKVGADNIIQHQGKTSELLKKWNKPIDMIFIDHSKENYLTDFKRIESRLSDNAVIIADNMLDNPRKVEDFRTYLENHDSFETQVITLDNGLLIATRKVSI